MYEMRQLAKDQYELVRQMTEGIKALVASSKETNTLLRLLVDCEASDDIYIKAAEIGTPMQRVGGTAGKVETVCDCYICGREKREALVSRVEKEIKATEQPKKVETRTLLEIAVDDLNRLSRTPNLPTRFGSQTVYEYVPETSIVEIHSNEPNRVVTAVLKDASGKFVKKAIAICAPDDKFYPEIGAAIAAFRLFDLPIPQAYLE